MTDLITAPETRDFRSFANYLYSYVLDMFRWECDFAPTWAFERILTTHGHCGIFRQGADGKPVLAFGGYSGEPTPYGFGRQYIGTDYSGNSYTGTVGDNVVVIWNNVTLSSDRPIVSAYAERYVETERSIINVLRGARITALVTASDNTDKQTLDNVVSAINNGDTVVKIPPVYREIDALDSGAKRFDILRLTDPKDTDKLQYLSRYRDDLLSAFLGEYGIDVNVVNKGSQVSKDELHSMRDAVSATVQQRLECRERDLDIVREWGYDITVAPNVGRKIEESEEQGNAMDDTDINV
jgi:hypothetical protein